jgi:methyltransferase (TIGR00027 family)
MSDRDQAVGITADGLVVIRASEDAVKIGVNDPFAAWFITDEGRKLAENALRLDQVYSDFNLARFKYTSGRLTALAGNFRQTVLLGSGYDTRALWLEVFQSGETAIFEVDTLTQLTQKQTILNTHNITIPAWNPYVPADLRQHADIPALLVERGFQPDQPALILLEGLVFFLPEETTRALLDPQWLGLARGSRVVFDFWTPQRVTTLNERAQETLGTALFKQASFLDDPEIGLMKLGYSEVMVNALEDVTANYFGKGNHAVDEFPASWHIAEAAV